MAVGAWAAGMSAAAFAAAATPAASPGPARGVAEADATALSGAACVTDMAAAARKIVARIGIVGLRLAATAQL